MEEFNQDLENELERLNEIAKKNPYLYEEWHFIVMNVLGKLPPEIVKKVMGNESLQFFSNKKLLTTKNIIAGQYCYFEKPVRHLIWLDPELVNTFGETSCDDQDYLEYIVAHEIAHYINKDHNNFVTKKEHDEGEKGAHELAQQWGFKKEV